MEALFFGAVYFIASIILAIIGIISLVFMSGMDKLNTGITRDLLFVMCGLFGFFFLFLSIISIIKSGSYLFGIF